MTSGTIIKKLTKETVQPYITIGSRSYKQHYSHLWENNDPSYYIDKFFTKQLLLQEIENSNTALFIIYHTERPVGILKLKNDFSIASYNSTEALLLDKIYILKEFAGKGIGNEVINFVKEYAKNLNKKVVWLEAMGKGPAIQFYLKYGFKVHSNMRHPSPKVIEENSQMQVMMLYL